MTEVTPADLVVVARRAASIYLRTRPALLSQKDDMLGDAMLAAHVAHQRWDGQGVFAGYAYPRVVFGIIDGLRARGRLTRRDYAARAECPSSHLNPLNLTNDDLVKLDAADPYAEDPYRRVEDRMMVSWLLSCLCGREREIICRVDLCGEMQAAVGRDMGISESRVCQLRRVGLWRLRSRMMEAG